MAISMHLQRAYDNAYDATGSHETARDASLFQYVGQFLYDAGLSGILKELGPDQVMTPQQVDSLYAAIENIAKRKPSLRWRIPSILALLAAARTTGDAVFVSF